MTVARIQPRFITPYLVVIPGSGNDSVFSNGEMQMSIEVLLNVLDAGELADLTDANLPPLLIAAHLRSLVRSRRHFEGEIRC